MRWLRQSATLGSSRAKRSKGGRSDVEEHRIARGCERRRFRRRRAGAQTPFTITDTIDFRTEARAFTATGPLCASGTYADDIVAFGAPAAPSVPHSLTNH